MENNQRVHIMMYLKELLVSEAVTSSVMNFLIQEEIFNSYCFDFGLELFSHTLYWTFFYYRVNYIQSNL